MSNFFKLLTKSIVCMFTLLILCLLIVFIPKYIIIKTSEYKSLINTKETYSNHLYKNGWSDGFGSYNLRSFDNGTSWYAFDYDTILGHVDSIYPGLLKHLTAWDNITKYCEENGPISGVNYKLLESDLNEVGITIEVIK